MATQRTMKAGVIGYGPSFGMGWRHLDGMKKSGFTPWAICDVSEERLDAARKEWPGLETYTDAETMLRKSDVELVAVILPHNLHCNTVVKCLNAGRHVVVEKPMACCLSECEKMVAAARKSKRMLSVYHNRHWDANILTILKHVPKIGRVYRWESFTGGYSKPGTWWRSNKTISGGTIFDWGAHFMEWMLQVLPYEMDSITGFGVKEVWDHCTNEDEVEAVVRFKGNAVASHTESMIAAADKQAIRICGTKGAITWNWDHVTVRTFNDDNEQVATNVSMAQADGNSFYANISDHLFRKKALTITPEHAMRVIQILDFASRSGGKQLKAKYV